MIVYTPGQDSAIVINVDTDDPMEARSVVIEHLTKDGVRPRRVFAVIDGGRDDGRNGLVGNNAVSQSTVDQVDQKRPEPAESEPELEPT
jgi:hypothetical protein